MQTNQVTRPDVTFAQQIAELNAGTTEAATLAPISMAGPLSPFPTSLLPQAQGLVDSTVATTDPATSTARGTLSLTYNLFTSGLRSGTIGAAREQVRFSELALQVAQEDLRLECHQ